MKLKELEQFLSSIRPFNRPKLELEQYATDAHIAARMVYMAATSFDDIEGKNILDLGCGCGILSLGCLVMGANSVLGVDIDEDALTQCRENMETAEIDEWDGMELVNASVFDLSSVLRNSFDTVVLNPPFGTKGNAGIDIQFLQTALRFGQVVYSMHKSSTRDHIIKTVDGWSAIITVLAQMKFLIPKQFRFHRQETVYVDVDLIRLERKERNC